MGSERVRIGLGWVRFWGRAGDFCDLRAFKGAVLSGFLQFRTVFVVFFSEIGRFFAVFVRF